MFDLDNLIRRYQQEFDLNDQTIVGALEFAKLTVLTDAEIIFSMEDLDEDDDLDDLISPNF
jgi:acetoacetate decarboxylase